MVPLKQESGCIMQAMTVQMQAIALQLSTFAIALIYYAYRDGYFARKRREQIRRQRVAYMLWVAASRMD